MLDDQDYKDRQNRVDETVNPETPLGCLRETTAGFVSRAVRDTANMNIDIHNGSVYNLQTGKVDFPVTQSDDDPMNAIAIPRAGRRTGFEL